VRTGRCCVWADAVPNLLIGLREGLEAGLIVSILLAAVVRSGRRDALLPLWTGVAGAITISLAFGAVLTFAAADLPEAAQEGMGGLLSLLAVALVTGMAFWMQRTARHMRAELTGKVDGALFIGVRMVALTALLAVGREGLEAALFLWSTTRTAAESVGPLLGAIVGIAIAVTICWGLYRQALRINLARFFTWTGAGLIVIAAGVTAYALGELQESGLLGGSAQLAFDLTRQVDPSSWYARIVEGVFNLTPRMTLLQAAGYLIYLVPALSLFARQARRSAKAAARARSAATTVAATTAAAQADTPLPASTTLRRRRFALVAGFVGGPAIVALAAVLVLGPRPAASAGTISVGTTCATDWTAPAAGPASFLISNTGAETLDVDLVSGDRGTVYAETDGLAPGTSRNLSVNLAPGAYAWACERLDGTTSYSDPETVHDPDD
jgi:high-affinity iron transporter